MWRCEFDSGAAFREAEAAVARQTSAEVRLDDMYTYGPWFGHRVISHEEFLSSRISYHGSDNNQHYILHPPPRYGVDPGFTPVPQHHVRARAIPEDGSEPTNRPTDITRTYQFRLRNRVPLTGSGPPTNSPASNRINDIPRRRNRRVLPLLSAMLQDDVAILDEHNFIDRRRDVGLDTDSMSYEDLLDLGEQVGVVRTRLTKEDILCHLKTKPYSASSGATTSNLEQSPCTICQDEYEDHDIVGSLDCGHEYHRDCLSKWLQVKNVCPLCKSTALRLPPNN